MALERVFIDSVNCDINCAVTDPYYQHLLPYVCGLGPRRAQALAKKIGTLVNSLVNIMFLNKVLIPLQGRNLSNCDQFVKASLLTTKVFLNAVGYSFLCIPRESSFSKPSKARNTDDSDIQHPLDNTHIHTVSHQPPQLESSKSPSLPPCSPLRPQASPRAASKDDPVQDMPPPMLRMGSLSSFSVETLIDSLPVSNIIIDGVFLGNKSKPPPLLSVSRTPSPDEPLPITPLSTSFPTSVDDSTLDNTLKIMILHGGWLLTHLSSMRKTSMENIFRTLCRSLWKMVTM
jgi:hypothetical protein